MNPDKMNPMNVRITVRELERAQLDATEDATMSTTNRATSAEVRRVLQAALLQALTQRPRLG
jgi:hypothetical protein